MIEYREVFDRLKIAPRGVIHVGGWVGFEDDTYRAMGFANRLFVEAQPTTFATLKQNLAPHGAHCENIAISDRNGRATFHVAANGQSSSILALKKHLQVYPHIGETATIEVETIRLDDLLSRDAYAGLQWNFLNIDIQGAELLALSGAVQTLRSLDILNLEVNFDELYDGAPHIRDLDGFLSAFDYIRADTVLSHATWGDAIYVRNAFTRAR